MPSQRPGDANLTRSVDMGEIGSTELRANQIGLFGADLSTYLWSRVALVANETKVVENSSTDIARIYTGKRMRKMGELG